jgi:hypothetical protein
MKKLNFGIILQIATLALIAFLVFGGSAINLGAATNYDSVDTTDGYLVDGTSIINGSGAFIGAVNGTAFQLDSGTTVNEFTCATATWNPGSISSTTDATTTIGIEGVTSGDFIFTTFATTTSGTDWFTPAGQITAEGTTASATVSLSAVRGSPAFINGLNLATSTIRACYIGF